MKISQLAFRKALKLFCLLLSVLICASFEHLLSQTDDNCEDIRRRLAIYEMYDGKDTIDVIKCLLLEEIKARRIDTTNARTKVNICMYPFIKTYYRVDDFVCKVSFMHGIDVFHSKDETNLKFYMFDFLPDSTARIEYSLGEDVQGIMVLKKHKNWRIERTFKQ